MWMMAGDIISKSRDAAAIPCQYFEKSRTSQLVEELCRVWKFFGSWK